VRIGLKHIIRVIVVMMGVSIIVTSMPTPMGVSIAQTKKTTVKKKNIFQLLFGKREKKVVKKTKKRTVVRRKKRSSSATAVASVVKTENSQSILVMGDFIASGLADGLKTAYKANPNISIIKKTRGSSSLARPDFYDWFSAVPQLVGEVNPKMIVFGIGASDRQDLQVDGKSVRFDTDPWWVEYRKRVVDLALLLKQQNVPVLWVGVPSFKFTKMTADVLAFNGIYRNEIEKVGGNFVDIWEGFVDENGKFIYTGSNIKGQQVRLRSSDGINLTNAGKRKLAFYAEKPITRFLGNNTSLLASLYSDQNPVIINNVRQDPRLATMTKIYAFTDPDLDGGDFLLGGNELPNKFEKKSPLDQLIENGLIVSAPTGRVDNFAWKLPLAEPLRLNSQTVEKPQVTN
tara:strand:- start:912 stop:2114 length:1203 start_codon:yes stop_codon:yes gene_type:complete